MDIDALNLNFAVGGLMAGGCEEWLVASEDSKRTTTGATGGFAGMTALKPAGNKKEKRMRSGAVCPLALAACLSSMSALAGGFVTETTDFSGADVPTGWNMLDGGYLSPEYLNAVSRIALAYEATGAQVGTAQLFVIDHASNAETQIASMNTLAVGATFDFPVTSDYRRFRIITSGLALTCFSATLPDRRPDAPPNVVATALTTESLGVSWDAVPGATSYRVSVWTNVVTGASKGIESWNDDFSRATAGSTSAGALDSDHFNSSYADTVGWECVSYIYPSTNSSAIRIGGANKDRGGALVSPPLPAGNWHLRMRAWRYRSEDGTDMPIQRVSAGVTSLVSIVAFTREATVPEEFLVDLPTLNEGDRLIFRSFTNKTPRVILDKIALVSGYSAGTSSPVVVREVPVADGTATTIDGLPPSVPVFVGVRTIDAGGLASAISTGVEVDLANPPPRAMLNAWTVSSPADSTCRQDFDSIAGATMTSGDKDFYNGVTIPFMQAWQDSDAVTKFAYYAGGNQTGAKFVAVATNINELARAFGARGKQDTTMTWGLAFTNNTGSTISLTNVSYSAQQWGFANTTNQLLTCEYLVTNRLDWIVNFSDGWQTCAETEARVLATHAMPESTAVDYVPAEQIRIAPGEVLYLKWTFHPPAKGSSALMAIDDLTVRFRIPEQGFLMRFVKHQANEVSP